MNILVTGATGFIGSALVQRLVTENHNVICIIRKSSNVKYLKTLPVSLLEADLTQKESLKIIPNNLDIVFHLAAHVDFSAVSQRAMNKMIDTNVDATCNIYLAMKEKNPNLKKFIYFSSLACMGFQREKTVTNYSPLNPDTLYGESKKQSEIKLNEISSNHNISVVILRPSLIYGIGDKRSDFLGSVRLIKKGLFPIFGNGNNIMSPLIYLDDLLMICLRFMGSKVNGTFICTNNEKFTINDFVKTISEILGRKGGSLKIPVWFGQFLITPVEILCKIINKSPPLNRRRIKDLSIDRKFSNIHQDLDKAIDYHPETDLKQGATKVIKWFRENNLI